MLSLCLQSFHDWEGIVVDNGRRIQGWSDDKFKYRNTRLDTQISGAIHTHSMYMATELGVAATTAEWLCFPNDDSYYVPWFAERMLMAAEQNDCDLVYCDMVHGTPEGGHHWLKAQPQQCSIDKTNFILKRSWFEGFPDTSGDNYHIGDWLLIESLLKRGIRHGRVPQILCVHN